jgi:hypothetical protein
MRYAIPTLCFALFSILSLSGCAGDGTTSAGADGVPDVQTPSDRTTPAPMPAALAEDLPILGKVTGDQLPVSDPMLNLINAEAVASLNLAERFAEQGFTLDPQQHSVILLSLGEQPTGGYAADITALQRKGAEVYVQGVATAPPADAATTSAITYPFAAVAVDKLPRNTPIRSDITSE